MRLHTVYQSAVAVLTVCACALLFAPQAQARDHGFYLGVDAMALQTTLDYGNTETYNTSHSRLRVGYQILKFLSVEGRFMSSGYDTDIDYLGNTYRFDTGSMAGFYVRPHTNFRNANVYGIVGLTSMDTRYRPVGAGTEDRDVVVAFTVGVGGTFKIVGNLTLDVEATLYEGVADYGANIMDTVSLYGVGVSAGLRYRF